MKSRKVFLDGYVELVPRLFKARNKYISAVRVNPKCGYIGLSVGMVHAAKIKLEVGEKVNATIAIHNSKDKFIIVIEEEGKFAIRRSNRSIFRVTNMGLADSLIECGFEDKRYKAESPEEGVIIVTKEEV